MSTIGLANRSRDLSYRLLTHRPSALTMSGRGPEGATRRQPPAAPLGCGPDADGALEPLGPGHGRDLTTRAREEGPAPDHDRAACGGPRRRCRRPRARDSAGRLTSPGGQHRVLDWARRDVSMPPSRERREVSP